MCLVRVDCGERLLPFRVIEPPNGEVLITYLLVESNKTETAGVDTDKTTITEAETAGVDIDETIVTGARTDDKRKMLR